MAKKTKGVKKPKSSSKKKSTAKKAAAKKPQAKRVTLHGVYDVIAAFEKVVLGSSHPRKAEMLKLADESKNAWKEFCLTLHAAGECEKPTPSFCDPIRP